MMNGSRPDAEATPTAGPRWAWYLGLASQFVFFSLLLGGLLLAWFLGAETADFRYVGF